MVEIFELTKTNPWWLDVAKIDEEPELRAFDQSLVKWQPHLSKYISLKQSGYSLYTVRGPRQVGKTTFTKILMRNLLIKEKVPASQIFYRSCDSVKDYRELESIIEGYISYSRSQDVNGQRHLNIFIDEITFVSNWQRAIKSLFQTKRLEDTTVIATGSHALGVREGLGELVGRTGDAGEDGHKIFVPMKFAEYISCVDQVSWSAFCKDGCDVGSKRRQLLKDFLQGNNTGWQLPPNLLMVKESLDNALNSYFVTGGLPIAINYYLRDKKIPCSLFQHYVNTTIADISKWGLRQSFAKEILAEVCRSLSSEISWTGLGKRLGSNHHSVQQYIDMMVLSFVVTYIKKLNPENRRVMSKQNKKVYFLDPFLFHAIHHWVSSAPIGDEWETCQSFLADSAARGKLVENIVQNHLVRFAFDQHPDSLYDPSDHLFHYNENGHDIDFILSLDGKLFPIEVRYQSSISSHDYAEITSFARREGTRAILVTKEHMRVTENLLEIPASLFLTLI
jgi:hypothetical protein